MKLLYIHPLPVRIWHWLNALGFLLLIATGFQLRYVGTINVIGFKTAVQLHNWIGFALIANFGFWLLYHLFSKTSTVYHSELSMKKHFADTFRQMMFYGNGIFRGEPNPYKITAERKFNPLQLMMYQVVMMFIVPLQFYTGVLLWDVAGFSSQVEFFGGVRVLDTVHVLMFVFFCAFIVMHVYLCSLGHTFIAHFKAMFTGYEEVEEDGAHGKSH